MQRPVQITFRDVQPSEALEAEIRDKVSGLERFHPRITGCHVTVEMAHKHKAQGKLFNVRIDVRVPGGEVVVNHDLSEDVYIAVREAFGAARRQLEDQACRQRERRKS